MLLMMRAIASAIIDELCRGSLTCTIYITPGSGMFCVADLKLRLVLHELIFLC